MTARVSEDQNTLRTNGAAGAPQTRVALVHDFLLDLRGAERVFLELCAMWPGADIYTAIYDEHGTEGRFSGRSLHTSFLQRLHPTARTFRTLLPLYPAAIESFDAKRTRRRAVRAFGWRPSRALATWSPPRLPPPGVARSTPPAVRSPSRFASRRRS